MRFKTLAYAAVSLLALSTQAYAQALPAADDQVAPEDASDIVVTGTLIRGIAPAGTNVVAVSRADVESSGATTVTELLTDVPQFGSFNDLQTLSGGGNFVTTNRPNLRNLPGFTTTGTSTTLLLVDGHRVVGMGISSTTPDADFVPTGIIERVEIVPDGGSALYGSDAVAGVVNFITNKRFDGAKVDARYGFGKDYHTFDANATIGKAWDAGSVWVSGNYTKNSSIFGRDRDHNFTPLSVVDGLQIRDTECSTPNLRVATRPGGATALYAAQSPAARNTANICDQSEDASLYPDQERYSVYAGVNQQLNDWLEFDARAFYYRKNSEFSLGQFSGAVNIGPAFLAPFGFTTSPFAVNLTGSPAETQSVNFALGPRALSIQNVKLDAWGVTPTFKADLGGDWQARALVGYSESKSTSINSRLASTATINGLVRSGAFNPYAPLTASAATLAALTNFETFGQAKQRQYNARLTADGSLFELPGGAVKVAVGLEYLKEDYDARKGDTVPANRFLLPEAKLSRNVKSAFAELVAPIFGSDGGMSLTATAAGRYDDYSDVGDTFNPKFGATFKPIDWISIRGAWGKSFVAPSLADNILADRTSLTYASGATFNFLAPTAVLTGNGFPAPSGGQIMIFLLGSSPNLQPQKATTWSVGADITPPMIPGLRLSATYYNLTYTSIIQLVPFIDQNLFFSTFAPSAFTLNPTQAQIDAVVGQAATISGASCAPQPSCVYGIQDVRKRNLGGFKQDGIDFSVDYKMETGFGGVDFSINGTHVLNRRVSPAAGIAYRPDSPFSDIKMRSKIGADVGNLRAEAIWNFNKGYTLARAVGVNNQIDIGSYSTFDLFFKYNFDGEGLLGDLAFTLTANNVFDKYPPIYSGGDIVRAQRGFRNGNTVGRLIQVGVSKKF